MAKTVEELKMEAKEKLNQSQQNQQLSSKELEEAKSKIAFLEAKMKVLEEQSSKSLLNAEEKKLEEEARKLSEQEEALRNEADIEKTLNEILKNEKNPMRSQDDENEKELSQKEFLSILGETVGKALDAQSKLNEAAVAKRLTATNNQVDAMRKVMVEFLSGLSVQNARSRFPDFDKYGEATQKIHAAHPTLSPEQAYLLAKQEAASKSAADERIETERPSEPTPWTPDRPFSTSRDVSEDSRIDGNPRQRFRSQISAAIDNVLAQKQR
jgi:hypothetical protein